MRQKIFYLFILIVVLQSCTEKPVPPTPPTPVNVMTVGEGRVWYYDKYPSTVQALKQVNLYPEVQGYITGEFYKEGSHVRKGQLLYEIDKRIYLSAYDQAAANLQVAQGNLDQAKQDADRYVYLNNVNAVAKQQYDHAVITLQNAQNSYKAAEEALKAAKTNLAYSKITAPFDGTIGFSQVRVGNMVTVGQTLLNTVSTDDPMGVDFLVNERQLPAFDKLDKQSFSAKDSLYTILLPDNSAYPYPGKISVIDRAVNSQTGAIRIRLEFPNPKNTLRSGMSCVVRVHNQDTTPQIVIPAKAIVEQMGEYFVFVVKDTLYAPRREGVPDTIQKKQGLFAFQKKVQTGVTIGSDIIIKSGLAPGAKIVTDGVQSLHDGSAVTLGGQKDGKEKGKESEKGQQSAKKSE